MLLLTFPITPAGLALSVWVGLSDQKTAAVAAAGARIPAPIKLRGLIDTGSNVSGVASWVLAKLGIDQSVSTTTHTAAGEVPVVVKEVSFWFDDPGQPTRPVLLDTRLRVMELPAALPDADVLVGRDIVLKQKLFVDGPAASFTLEIVSVP